MCCLVFFILRDRNWLWKTRIFFRGIFSCHVSSLEQFSSARPRKQRASCWIKGVLVFVLWCYVLFWRSLGWLILVFQRVIYEKTLGITETVFLVFCWVRILVLIIHVQNFCKQIKELKGEIGPLSGHSLIYCTDACLKRYLEARNWNVDKSKKMLGETLKWRSTYKPEEIRWVSSGLASSFQIWVESNFGWWINKKVILIFLIWKEKEPLV